MHTPRSKRNSSSPTARVLRPRPDRCAAPSRRAPHAPHRKTVSARPSGAAAGSPTGNSAQARPRGAGEQAVERPGEAAARRSTQGTRFWRWMASLYAASAQAPAPPARSPPPRLRSWLRPVAEHALRAVLSLSGALGVGSCGGKHDRGETRLHCSPQAAQHQRDAQDRRSGPEAHCCPATDVTDATAVACTHAAEPAGLSVARRGSRRCIALRAPMRRQALACN